jgi:hypothetical protein
MQTNPPGVVEVRPLPVVVDFYPPAQLGAVDRVGKPCVRTLGAVEMPGRDDFAVRIDDSERNHVGLIIPGDRFSIRFSPVQTAARASVAPAMLFRCETATSIAFCPDRTETLW